MWPSRTPGLALQGLLAVANLDLPWLSFSPLGQRDLQNAFVIVGFHLLCIHRVRKLERADEGTIVALNAMEVLFLLFLLEFAFALDRQSVVFHADIDVAFVNARNFQLDDQALLVLINVNRGDKTARRQLFLTVRFGKISEKAREFAEGVNTSNQGHGLFSFRCCWS